MKMGIEDRDDGYVKSEKPLEIEMPEEDAKKYLYTRACKRYGEQNLCPPKRRKSLTDCFTHDRGTGILMFWYNIVHDFTTRAEIAILKGVTIG